MESLLLGLNKEPQIEDDTNSSSTSVRLVPWLSWDEWLFVNHNLFFHFPDSVSPALNRISAWRSRGCLPVHVDVTASIIEIQLKDPFFRAGLSNDASLSDELLAMLYCMTIMRLVNGVVEKTRKKELVSIAVAADAIGIPRMLIDIRHEGSHRELPSLNVVRSASVKALDWLKSYYWEPQSKAIPFQGYGNVKFKKEIKSKIRELVICLKVNGNLQSSPKGKRSKKQVTRIFKAVLRLYSSFSSEIVSVLLEYLLKALSSSEFKENADDASVVLTVQNVLADWKVVILKLSNKEPELLLNLLREVLDMIETQEDMKFGDDNPSIGISCSREELRQSDNLFSLFAWLVGILSKVPSAAANMPKRLLLELLQKCLLVSQLCNKRLMGSALDLAELMDDRSLLERIKRLSHIALSNLDNAVDEGFFLLTSMNIFQFEESIREAAKKLELVKQQIMKSRKQSVMDEETRKSQTWTLAESWNPCPIGMLPRAVGSSGCLPVLDYIDNRKQNQVSERKDNWKLIQHGAKRDATLDLQQLDNSTVKKMRETNEFGKLNDILATEGEKGCLMVGGVWKRVTDEELQAIESSVRILV